MTYAETNPAQANPYADQPQGGAPNIGFQPSAPPNSDQPAGAPAGYPAAYPAQPVQPAPYPYGGTVAVGAPVGPAYGAPIAIGQPQVVVIQSNYGQRGNAPFPPSITKKLNMATMILACLGCLIAAFDVFYFVSTILAISFTSIYLCSCCRCCFRSLSMTALAVAIGLAVASLVSFIIFAVIASFLASIPDNDDHHEGEHGSGPPKSEEEVGLVEISPGVIRGLMTGLMVFWLISFLLQGVTAFFTFRTHRELKREPGPAPIVQSQMVPYPGTAQFQQA
eukprot:CAMPEP_0114544214 /NCGR_PEP_ID=MMETSP0114-20121206/2758_1 /TAXON_ID=31324 /ORGANISM="Goniomonas sp, Strain m" /LENGTH=278 /DNA_ID=CAMNT_0001728581 /DNA_START=8 /DNA_END=844 /DNA_ORIENTATION=-